MEFYKFNKGKAAKLSFLGVYEDWAKDRKVDLNKPFEKGFGRNNDVGLKMMEGVVTSVDWGVFDLCVVEGNLSDYL